MIELITSLVLVGLFYAFNALVLLYFKYDKETIKISLSENSIIDNKESMEIRLNFYKEVIRIHNVTNKKRVTFTDMKNCNIERNKHLKYFYLSLIKEAQENNLEIVYGNMGNECTRFRVIYA